MSEHLFAGIRVVDLGVARDFYERLLGREPDLVPNDTEAAWRLHEGAWIVLIAEEDSLGRTQHTLIVRDLDGFVKSARERGIEPGPVEPVGPDMRQILVTDPDGNRLKVAARAVQVSSWRDADRPREEQPWS